jgi:hypothetical protein
LGLRERWAGVMGSAGKIKLQAWLSITINEELPLVSQGFMIFGF